MLSVHMFKVILGKSRPAGEVMVKKWSRGNICFGLVPAWTTWKKRGCEADGAWFTAV